MKKDALIIVRGAGDLATGTIHRLWAAGFRVLALEAEHPVGRWRCPKSYMRAESPWKV